MGALIKNSVPETPSIPFCPPASSYKLTSTPLESLPETNNLVVFSAALSINKPPDISPWVVSSALNVFAPPIDVAALLPAIKTLGALPVQSAKL